MVRFDRLSITYGVMCVPEQMNEVKIPTFWRRTLVSPARPPPSTCSQAHPLVGNSTQYPLHHHVSLSSPRPLHHGPGLGQSCASLPASGRPASGPCCSSCEGYPDPGWPASSAQESTSCSSPASSPGASSSRSGTTGAARQSDPRRPTPGSNAYQPAGSSARADSSTRTGPEWRYHFADS